MVHVHSLDAGLSIVTVHILVSDTTLNCSRMQLCFPSLLKCHDSHDRPDGKERYSVEEGKKIMLKACSPKRE